MNSHTVNINAKISQFLLSFLRWLTGEDTLQLKKANTTEMLRTTKALCPPFLQSVTSPPQEKFPQSPDRIEDEGYWGLNGSCFRVCQRASFMSKVKSRVLAPV
ncbi:hypothetical protein UPYG_G00158280 [Umbra pygmaea]|uniref:Uncharacterized protein n=1 Tax=Umbra pygmaea TaxID=75934 RepID=A0ABD0X357_UMBPY